MAQLVNGTESSDDRWIDRTEEHGIPFLALIFLVAGFIGMSCAAVFFLVMALRYDGDKDVRPLGPIFHYIVFFIAAVSSLCYYSMWTGTGLLHVEEHNGDVRIVFVARYVDWIVTTPLILISLALLGNSPTSSIVGLVGCDLLMVACGYIGAVVSPSHKFFWWGAGMLFFVVLVYMLLQELSKATEEGRVSAYDAETLRGLSYLTIFVWGVYPIVWMLGQEGTGFASLNAEECMLTLADLLAKAVFGLILVNRLSDDLAAKQPYTSTFV